MSLDAPMFQSSISQLVGELTGGPTDQFAFVLGNGDPGLLGTLENISAETASRSSSPKIHTIAGHANHLRFCLEVLNSWAHGDDNAFATADWPSSWAVTAVSADQWASLIEDLRTECERWQALSLDDREWDAIAVSGAIASVAHLAYHMAAIRHITPA